MIIINMCPINQYVQRVTLVNNLWWTIVKHVHMDLYPMAPRRVMRVRETPFMKHKTLANHASRELLIASHVLQEPTNRWKHKQLVYNVQKVDFRIKHSRIIAMSVFQVTIRGWRVRQHVHRVHQVHINNMMVKLYVLVVQ